MWPESSLPVDKRYARHGLCIPLSSELDKIPEFFDQDTFDVFLHEFQHVSATIGLFDDLDIAFDHVLLVTGFANPSLNCKGLTIVSDILEEDKIGAIAAAGLIAPPDTTAQFGSDDRLQVEKICVKKLGSRDINPLVQKGQDALDKSALVPAIRVKMAKMCTFLQKVYDFPVITSQMLRAIYDQALREVEVEENSVDPTKGRMFYWTTLAQYKEQAVKLAGKYYAQGAEGIYGVEIETDFRRAEATPVCPTCGQSTTHLSTPHGCN